MAKRADQSGARFAVIVGEEEAVDGSVQLKDLRGESGQQRIPLEALVEAIRNHGDTLSTG